MVSQDDGVLYYWHKDTRAVTWSLPVFILDDGLSEVARPLSLAVGDDFWGRFRILLFFGLTADSVHTSLFGVFHTYSTWSQTSDPEVD